MLTTQALYIKSSVFYTVGLASNHVSTITTQTSNTQFNTMFKIFGG